MTNEEIKANFKKLMENLDEYGPKNEFELYDWESKYGLTSIKDLSEEEQAKLKKAKTINEDLSNLTEEDLDDIRENRKKIHIVFKNEHPESYNQFPKSDYRMWINQ